MAWRELRRACSKTKHSVRHCNLGDGHDLCGCLPFPQPRRRAAPSLATVISSGHNAGFSDVLQVDGYAAYKALTDARRAGGPLTLAFCWAHLRRRFYDIAKGGNAPIAEEALARIGKLYEIEADIRGRSADERRAERQARSKPITDELKPWLEKQLTRVSRGAPIADDIRYGLSHWDGLTRFLDDGRIVSATPLPPSLLLRPLA
jgi:transposase